MMFPVNEINLRNKDARVIFVNKSLLFSKLTVLYYVFILIYVLKSYTSFNQKRCFMTLLPTWPNVSCEILPLIGVCRRKQFTFMVIYSKTNKPIETTFCKTHVCETLLSSWSSKNMAIIGNSWFWLATTKTVSRKLNAQMIHK